MHDCRADCEALYYLHSIRPANMWDTQVAHGVLQLLRGMANAPDGGMHRIGLNPLLEVSQLPAL